jgi:LPXTG-motif cell wall-anchored protein
MPRVPGRFLLGALLALALGGHALAAEPMRPARAATTWQAGVGGESADHALQVQAFLPSTLTIDEGDTVQWTTNAEFVHTVTFLSGGQAPPVVSVDNGTVYQPNETALPSGGPSYDGSGFVNSGLLEGKGKTFALTFTKAGSYPYLCLLHPGMTATLVVQPAGAAYPLTQAQVNAQAGAELYAKLAQGNQDLQSAQLTSRANANGTTSYTVVNGAGGNQVSVLRFLPVDLTVKAGDQVTWLGNDPHEIHTVTFYDPAGKVPDFIVPQPQGSGPPRLVIPHAAPENDTAVDSQDLYNSGVLGPGASYTFSFPKPGVYTYVCVVHAPQGMFGKIIVQAANQPASLPRTGGENTPQPFLLLGGALVLLLLGLLARRRGVIL